MSDTTTRARQLAGSALRDAMDGRDKTAARTLGRIEAETGSTGLAIAICSCLVPRKRSTALRTPTSLFAIFMLAIAWTMSGMPPLEYALCTATSTAKRRMSMRLTFSRKGIRKPRPPCRIL